MDDRAVEVEAQTCHEESGPPGSDIAVDQPFRIGRYTVTRRLGAGGMGIVYAAYDDELDRRIALKLLHVNREQGSLGRSRMLREAQALAKLSHPNVVQVYEVGSVDGRLYLAMEFLDGTTLRAWRKSQHRTWREILAVYLQAGRGLAAAHAAGLVHRDFKPDNVIVGDDARVRVLDFGLARVHEGDKVEVPLSRSAWDELARVAPVFDSQGLSGPLTEAGALLGTPAYMSPEQLLRGPADARSDQFCFCVALWEALFDARPFVGRTLAELAPQVFRGPPRAPHGPAPAALARVLRRGLALDRGARYPDMPALLDALTEAAQRGRKRLIVIGAAAVVLVASAAGYALAGLGETGSRCEAGAALVGAWDPAARDEARSAVLVTGVPFAGDAWAAAASRLDTYASGLQSMLHHACLLRQSGALPATTLTLHEACLERRQAELDAVVQVLRRADPDAVRGALPAASGLTPLERCSDLAALRAEAEEVPPPTEPERARQATALRTRLDAARAEHDAGRFTAARELAAAIVDEAERLGYAPLLAEALHRLGSTELSLADLERAQADLHRAFALAESARHDVLAAAVTVQLVHLHGTRLRELPAALFWRELADAKLRRIGDPPTLRVQLLNSTGVTLMSADKLSEGAEALEQALELAAPRRAEAPLDYVRALNALAMARIDQSRLDEAETLLREALAVRRRILGPNHPDVAVVLHNLGKVQLTRHDDEAAVDSFRLALAIRERGLGPTHSSVADTLGGYAVASCQAGHDGECIGLLQRTLALAEAVHGREDISLVVPLNNLGSELMSRGDFARAQTHLERALAILRAQTRDDGDDAALILYNLGILHKLRGEPAAAIGPLARSLAIREHVHGQTHVEVAFAASHLAEALRRGGRAAEAEAAARRAHAILAAHPEAVVALVRDRLTEAALRWRDDRAAATTLARKAAEGLPIAPADEARVRDEIESWLTARAVEPTLPR